jgi:hypothetical protein
VQTKPGSNIVSDMNIEVSFGFVKIRIKVVKKKEDL